MERIVKILVVAILFMLPFNNSANAEGWSILQNIPYENCTKVFNMDNLNLFYLTISSINTNKFTVEEIQSKSGYILFTAFNRKYLATVANVNTNQSMLKITPTDNNYNFQPAVLSNMFNYINSNLKTKPQNIVIN